MDSDTERRYHDHKVVLLEEGSTIGRSSAPWFNWFLYSVGVVFLVFMFAVVARQQLQISAMEESIAEFQQDLFGDDIPFRDTAVYSSNDTGTAILHRSRRQSSASRLTPLAHLRGELTGTRLPKSTSHAYLWIDPGSNPHTSVGGSRTNVCTIPKNVSDPVYVQALSVSVEGWYYVYAQLPYTASGYEKPVGHRIVVISNHNRSQPEDVLAASSTLPPSSPDREFDSRNWQYLGGLVYLSSGAHVEVRPVDVEESGEKPFSTEDSSREGGAFFGLFLVMENNPYGHGPIDSEC